MSLNLRYAEAVEAAPVRLAIQQISLSQFRNYADVRLTPDSAPVVLTGANGSGKTNLLEAVSLLVPGRGMRRASLSELQKQNGASPWAVAVEINAPAGPMQIGTGLDPDCTPNASGEMENERRVVMIEGRAAKNQQALANHVAMTWITPDMDRVLAEGPGARRKFLDRLVYSFDPAHAGRVHRYEKAMRERLYLLREGGGDNAWFAALEDTMAQSGVAIAAARRHLLQQLQLAMTDCASVFPQADLYLEGLAENKLDHAPALLVEDHLRDELARTRRDDALNGTCSVGPHRSDLRVIHRAKACPADLCSTGEQKALLIAVMLAYVRTLTATRQLVPIVLLDDIVAHLDSIRRDALFEEIIDLGVQAWLTGTDRQQFEPFLSHVQHYEIAHGAVV